MHNTKITLDKEKLLFLIALTKTRGKELADACHYSPSYVSKVLSGQRTISGNDEFIKNASLFFACAIHNETQRAGASKVILNGEELWPKDTEEGAKLIASWMSNNTSPLEQNTELSSHYSHFNKSDNTFFGNEGKRQAVLTALSMLDDKNKPIDFFIYTDENLRWFTEDPTYLKKWQQQLEKVLDKGGCVTSIFCENHLKNNTKLGLKMWLPFLSKGKLKVYVDTQQENIYHKTLFIGGNDIGIISTSIGDDTINSVTTIIDDPASIHTLQEEFDGYLKKAIAFNGNRLGLLVDHLD